MIDLLKLNGVITDPAERKLQPGAHGDAWMITLAVVAILGIAAVVTAAIQTAATFGWAL